MLFIIIHKPNTKGSRKDFAPLREVPLLKYAADFTKINLLARDHTIILQDIPNFLSFINCRLTEEEAVINKENVRNTWSTQSHLVP